VLVSSSCPAASPSVLVSSSCPAASSSVVRLVGVQALALEERVVRLVGVQALALEERVAVDLPQVGVGVAGQVCYPHQP